MNPVRTSEVDRAASELRLVLGQLVRRLRAEHRLPLSHGAVLGRLERGGPSTASALAAAERVRPQSIAQIVADLDEDGLVTRRPDPSDGRQTLVELAPRGREALEEDRRRRDGWLTDAIHDNLSDQEQLLLIDAVALLQRLVKP